MRASAEMVLAGFARRQYGIATRAQLVDATLHVSQVEYLVKSGRLERLFRAVYRVAGVPAAWLQNLLAACWAGGDRGGVVSHRAAAALWGLPGGVELLEVTSPRWRRTQQPGIVAHETNCLRAIDLTVHDGIIPVTRPARTFLDLCALVAMGALPQSTAEDALQEAIRRDLVDITLVGRRYEELGGDVRLGGKVAYRLMNRWIPDIARTDSRPEARLLKLIASRGLPDPVPQYRVWLGPDEFLKLDFAWPEHRIGLEFDSYRWHGGRVKHDADARRELRLKSRRWDMIRVTDAELDAGCPNALEVLASSLAVARGA